MSKGKIKLYLNYFINSIIARLLILGDSDYIKKKFGVGYHLGISLKSNELKNEESFHEIKEKIKNLVYSKVNGSSLDIEYSKNDLNFVLPFYSQNQFTDLFFTLENFKDSEISVFYIF